MTTDNPYRAPLRGPAGEVRPSSPKVLGILAIIFAAFGILSIPFMLLSVELLSEEYARAGLSQTYVRFSQIVSAASSVWLLVTGIGLVQYKKWSRVSFNIYAGITIVMTLIMGYYTISHLLVADYANEAERLGAIGGSFGSLAGLLYPVLGLIFLNREKVKNALR